MIQGLLAEEVEFVVIGGVAAVAHGSTYQTNDLDICYRVTAPNLNRLCAVLQRWKAYPRDWEPGHAFAADPRTLKVTPTLNLRTTEGFLDVLSGVTGLNGYATARKRSDEVTAFSLRFRVLSLQALIVAKEAAGRPKDLMLLPELRALQELRDSGG